MWLPSDRTVNFRTLMLRLENDNLNGVKHVRNQGPYLPTILKKVLILVLQGPYSPTILKNVLGLVLQIFLYLAAFECNTTSDFQSEVLLHSI